MTPKGHSVIRGRRDLHYYPTGHGDLYGQFDLVYDPKIGRFSSSEDNFVSDSGNCLFIGRTDFHPKKRNSDAHYRLYLRALQLSFSDGD